MNNHSIQTEKLNFWTKLAYGAGDFGPAICANIQLFFLLPFLNPFIVFWIKILYLKLSFLMIL